MPGTALYNVPALLRFKGDLNPQALEQAFSAVVNRHDVLRATFEVREGVPVQVCGAGDVLHFLMRISAASKKRSGNVSSVVSPGKRPGGHSISQPAL